MGPGCGAASPRPPPESSRDPREPPSPALAGAAARPPARQRTMPPSSAMGDGSQLHWWGRAGGAAHFNSISAAPSPAFAHPLAAPGPAPEAAEGGPLLFGSGGQSRAGLRGAGGWGDIAGGSPPAPPNSALRRSKPDPPEDARWPPRLGAAWPPCPGGSRSSVPSVEGGSLATGVTVRRGGRLPSLRTNPPAPPRSCFGK